MAALKVNPDNSLTIPFPLLAILLTFCLAVAAWGGSIRNDVADNKREVAELKQWKAEHEKRAAEQLAQVLAANAKTEAAAADYYARQTAQNAAIQETLTNVRITLAAKR
ncbi:hypothetical protein [Hymenobacter properus]|uniref:Uncharacterized protein n=1 Tax=Hymenobacter properus TaxID=2791026 RepID=A0A931FIJ6_9BACT|nr:hypothetical protein [Hymenobacter properus]MBF9140863.1 hypothetical protein [Hymenobacter properus]MBR7719672.1 hypothetical protein [Microvirga sp. SRT04]